MPSTVSASNILGAYRRPIIARPKPRANRYAHSDWGARPCQSAAITTATPRAIPAPSSTSVTRGFTSAAYAAGGPAEYRSEVGRVVAARRCLGRFRARAGSSGIGRAWAGGRYELSPRSGPGWQRWADVPAGAEFLVSQP